MASIGHIAVGLAAARVYHRGLAPSRRSMAAWSALSMLPDADVAGFALGVAYSAPWGHRGATHSLTAAVAGGIACGMAARRSQRPALRAGILATAVLASHGLLDTLTDGGLGAALFWPFDLTRYFAPWQPIPVAPIGLDFLSSYGLFVALTELVFFAPLLVWALRSRPMVWTRAAAGLALWLVAAGLIGSIERVREAVLSRLQGDDTAYSSGFTETAFRAVAIGQSEVEVRRRLGVPREEGWFYLEGRAMDFSARDLPPGCRVIRFENGVAVEAKEPGPCTARGVTAGLSLDEVRRRMGPPPESCWDYTWSPSHSHVRQRTICVSKGQVAVVAGFWR